MKGGARVVVVPSPLVGLAERWAARVERARESARAATDRAATALADAKRAARAGDVASLGVMIERCAKALGERDGYVREAAAYHNAAAELWDVIENGGAA